ncbi:MAG: MFS transporter, partial [Mycobacteriaceae bacterium]
MTVTMFAGFTLLLPVVPLQLVGLGGSAVAAAAATTVFMLTTVLTQLGVPALLRRRGHRWVIVVGGLLLGGPALLYPGLGSVSAVLGVTAVRGCGFGLLTVAAGALVAELVPPRRLGRATGIYGVAIGAPQLVTLPVGLALAAQHGPTPVLLAGGVLPLVGALVALGLPAHTAPAAAPAPPRLPVPAVVAPVLAMVVVAVSFGATVTNLALAVPERAGTVGVALSALTGAMLVGRVVAGPLAERLGAPGRLLPAGVLLAAAGAAGLALAVGSPSTSSLVLGAGVFGAGFGLVQTDSMVAMFAIAGPARFGPAS